MQYDPIKRSLGEVFNKRPILRKLFYRMLDLLLLRTWHVKREIRKWIRENGKSGEVVDAGSGFGQYSYFLGKESKDWKITGLDVKEEQIEDCNQFFNKIGFDHVSFHYADLTQYNEQNRYDLALSVDVMEHILEDVKVFENICRALKPGGMLLISTPSDQGGSDVHDHDHESFIDEHVRDGYNIDEIREKLKKGGFSKSEARYSYGTPGKISWRISMKYPILMLNKSRLFFVILPFYYLLLFPFALILNYMDARQNHKTGTGLIVKAWK
ncbi:MAG: class I SAM-dependent methyltransferase [Bacteroidales bacterium]|nr:class I SAM-dependent methyltransferase [Bacteroidales bacterium]